MSQWDSTLLRWCIETFGQGITERVFAPLLADWQRDRDAASTAWRRALRDLSGASALAMTIGQVTVRLGLPWGVPGRDLRAVGVTLAVHAVIGLAVGLAPFLLAPLSVPLRNPLLVWIAPSMMAVSLTVALLPTAAVIHRRSRDRWAPRAPWLVAGVTIATMAVLLVLIGWVTPASKQAFRVRTLAATSTRSAETEPDGGGRLRRNTEQHARLLPRGVNELTLPELLASAEPRRVYPQVTTSTRHREALLRLTLLTVWPATFAVFGWRLARSRRSLGFIALSGWWTLAVVTCLFSTFGGLDSGPRQLSAVGAAAATWLIAALVLRRNSGAHAPSALT